VWRQTETACWIFARRKELDCILHHQFRLGFLSEIDQLWTPPDANRRFRKLGNQRRKRLDVHYGCRARPRQLIKP
jgi:hypothetical protein